jgi:hypothetical protein
MNRKDFFASIPLLSAIPFISAGIEREQNKIILLDPKPIEIIKDVKQVKNFHYSDFELHLVWNNCTVGVGYPHHTSFSCEPFYHENFGIQMHTRTRLQASAQFDYEKVMQNIEKIIGK